MAHIPAVGQRMLDPVSPDGRGLFRRPRRLLPFSPAILAAFMALVGGGSAVLITLP